MCLMLKFQTINMQMEFLSAIPGDYSQSVSRERSFYNSRENLKVRKEFRLKKFQVSLKCNDGVGADVTEKNRSFLLFCGGLCLIV